MRWVQTFVLLSSLASSRLPTLAQGISPSQPVLNAHSREDSSIVLDAVMPPAGPALTAADLTITDNGHRVPSDQLEIMNRQHQSAPAQLLLVIDTINSSIQETSRGESAVAAFLRQGGGKLSQPTTILVISDSAPRGQDPSNHAADTADLHHKQLFVHRIPTSTDGDMLAKGLDDYSVGLSRILDSQAADAVSERVRLSLEALSYIATAEANVPGAKVTVWLSPGWPFLAKSDAKSAEQLFDSVVYFSDSIRLARMIIHMVNPAGVTNQDNSAQNEAFLLASRPGSIRAAGHAPNVPEQVGQDYYKAFVKGVKTPMQSNANDLSLQVLAIQSGGSVTQQNNDLRALITHCAADVTHLAVIRYTPQGDGNGGSTTYHEVQTTIAHPSQTLRTRTGFYLR
jgi:VWFA-related protein